jgi:hypothetical protein
MKIEAKDVEDLEKELAGLGGLVSQRTTSCHHQGIAN